MPVSGETSIPLSQEPWAESSIPLSHEPWAETATHRPEEPWAEPAIWQPPAPAKKSKRPYVLLAAGAVVLAAVALGIVFWPSGSGNTAGTTGGPTTDQQSQTLGSTGNPSGSPTTTSSGPDLVKQAGRVDSLLSEMETTRSDLGTVVAGGCGTAGLQRIRGQRQEQLEKARALETGALDNGTELKDALVRALEASVESNQRYLDAAPGCPSDDEVQSINQQASDAKNEFIRYWGPIASKVGLTPRNGDTI